MFLKFISLLLFLNYVSARDIPSYVHLCDRTDPKVAQCFINTVYEMMPHLVEGIPEMNLPPIDPFKVESITLDSRNSETVRIFIVLSDLVIKGLRNIVFKKHTMDFDNVHFNAIMEIPKLFIIGEYKVDGKVLLADINTSGHADINASNLMFEGDWYGSYYTKKGKEHITIETINITTLQFGHVDVKFGDAFEDKQVSKTFNKYVNDNLEALFQDLNPVIKETIGELLKGYFNGVYKLFPVDQLYPKK